MSKASVATGVAPSTGGRMSRIRDRCRPGVNATTMVAPQPKETTMERHEIDAELNTPGAQELLAGTSAAHLAYVGSDATPRVIPVGFW